MSQPVVETNLTNFNYKQFQDFIVRPCTKILEDTVKNRSNYHTGLICPVVSLKVKNHLDLINFKGDLRYIVEYNDNEEVITLNLFSEHGNTLLRQDLPKS